MPEGPGIKVWSIGGGKGGIGKSIFSLGLGISLARLGKEVILIDGDLGGANLHTLMGVRFPPVTLEHFLLNKASQLEDVVIKTEIDRVSLICGADDILGAANPTYSQKIRLLKQIEDLPADFVLIDLAAGTSFNTLDLFNYSPGKIAIFTSQTTSLQNAYGFIKSALYRKLFREFAKVDGLAPLLYEMANSQSETTPQSINDLLTWLEDAVPDQHARMRRMLQDFQVLLVVNMVKTHQDRRSPEIIQSVCADFLSIHPQILGHLPYDPAVELAVNQMKPFLMHQKRGKISAGLHQIAERFLIEGRLHRH